MIHFVDLKGQYATIRDEINEAVQRVLDSCTFILGPEVRAFEQEFARYCEAEHCVGVSSGLDALKCALIVAGIGPGDEVVVPANTYIATALAVSAVGAVPRLVDCEDEYFNIDPEAIAGAINEKTKAILPVHLYGQPADMDPILAVAGKKGLLVIEDAAQAHGARYKGKRAGTIGDIGCFSFYPGKNLGAYGDGGAVVTNNEKYVEAVRLLRDYGQAKKHHHVMKGQSLRLDGIQAAVLRVKLKRLEGWNEARRRNAAAYGEHLSDSGLELPQAAPWAEHVFHLFVVRSPIRDRILEHLNGRQIYCGLHYPIPIHLQQAYSDLGHGKGDFPVAESQAKAVLSLPMHPELTEDEIRQVADEVRAVALTHAAHRS